MNRPRTPLLRPQSYFEAHDDSPPLKHAAIAVGIVTLLTAAMLGLFLAEFAGAVDATVAVDNPAHRPDWACDGPGATSETPIGCDPSVPETVERDVGSLVAEELSWLPWASLVFVPLFWLFQAAVLHGASGLGGGEGSFDRTLAVAGWGMVPSVARVLGVGALVVYQLRTTPLPGDPQGAMTALEAALAGMQTASLLAAVVVAVWAGAVRVHGLAAARRVRTSDAFAIVFATTAVGLLFELF